MIKEVMEKVGKVQFWLILVLVVASVWIFYNTSVEPNTIELVRVNNVTGQEYSEQVTKYHPNSMVPKRSMQTAELVILLAIAVIMFYTLYHKEVKEQNELEIHEVIEYAEGLLEYQKAKGFIENDVKILGIAKRQYDKFVNTETGEETINKPFRWVLPAQSFSSDGTVDNNYLIYINAFNDQIGPDRFDISRTSVTNLDEIPDQMKYIISEDAFDKKVGRETTRKLRKT